jgi:hypothetical protein
MGIRRSAPDRPDDESRERLRADPQHDLPRVCRSATRRSASRCQLRRGDQVLPHHSANRPSSTRKTSISSGCGPPSGAPVPSTDERTVTLSPKLLVATGDPATALFTQLSRMTASGAENVAVKSALMAAEFDLRAAAPAVAADLTGQVADLLDRAQAAGAETSRGRSAHIAQLILDGLRPQPR